MGTIMLFRILRGATLVLCLVTTAKIVLLYAEYFPLNPQAEFVVDHALAFQRTHYRTAFYAHIIASPCCFLVALVLLSATIRNRWRRLHRVLGRVQVAAILLILVPTSVVMANHAFAGRAAGVSFLVLSAMLTVCTLQGWRTAIRGTLAQHRRWMLRVVALLSSAIVLRVLSGMMTQLGVTATEDAYLVAAWLSWLAPLLALEVQLRAEATNRRISDTSAA
jgi:uncharacterized membrane protein